MSEEREVATRPESQEPFALTLFVSGASGLSARAIDNVQRLCDAHLAEGWRLTVVDIHNDPDAALSERIHAVPTLVRSRPLPVRRLVGDLSQADRVLAVLRVAPGGAAEARA
jgi:circadian clock protein KaiB